MLKAILMVCAAFVSLLFIPGHYSDVWSDAPSLFFFWGLVFSLSVCVFLIQAVGMWLFEVWGCYSIYLVFSLPVFLFLILSVAVWVFSLFEGRLLFTIPAGLYLGAAIAIGRVVIGRRVNSGTISR